MKDEALALALSYIGASSGIDLSEVAGERVDATAMTTIAQWREMFNEVNEWSGKKIPLSNVEWYALQILKISGGNDYDKALAIAKQL